MNVKVLVNIVLLVLPKNVTIYVLLESASVIQKLTILESKNGLVLSNTLIPVSGIYDKLFPRYQLLFLKTYLS